MDPAGWSGRDDACGGLMRDEQRLHDLQCLATGLWALPFMEQQERLDALSAQINTILSESAPVSGAVMDVLYEICEEMLDNLEGDMADLHCYLRHVKHGQEGYGEYPAVLAEKLSRRFSRFALQDITYGQFTSPQRDGAMHLSPWGELALERMDERQTVRLYGAVISGQYRQIYNLAHERTL